MPTWMVTLRAFPATAMRNSTPITFFSTPLQQYFKWHTRLFLELLHLWSISSPYPKSDQIPLLFQSLLPYPHLTIYLLFFYSTNIYCLYNLAEPSDSFILSSIPISRASRPSFLSQPVQTHCASHHLHPGYSLDNTLDPLASAQRKRITR